ncbi:MAG: DNA-directed RNA polymerase subunit delta [Bacilli bacterium]|jgi:DNA-directed RNA polymerase subunit delta|nr:DNA-directed RNA polymerase subunit delta [Bacilli bacterium]
MANDHSNSYIEVAYQVLSDAYKANKKSEPVKFSDLLLEVGKRVGVTDEETLIEDASRFYTALTSDGRFVIKGNNTWVLREHEKFEDAHIDMNEVYSEDDADEEDEEKKDDSDSEDKEPEEEKDEEEAPAEEDEDENN